eukprot:7387389-Prymnesium_polylepis.1
MDARRTFSLAAVQGDAVAQCTLGAMHLKEESGGPPDLQEARRLLGLAASQRGAEVQSCLGLMHSTGAGGPLNVE